MMIATEVMTAKPLWFWHDGFAPEDKVAERAATPPSSFHLLL
jgi:hypothetical protein